MGLSLLKPLSRSVGLARLELASKGWFGGGGVLATFPMPKSVSFSRKGKRSTVDGFVIAYLYSVELFGIYNG